MHTITNKKFLVAFKALLGFTKPTDNKISNILFARLASIIFIVCALLAYNTLHLKYIGQGLGLFSGYFAISTVSLSTIIFLFLIFSCILGPYYSSNFRSTSNKVGDKEVKSSNTLGCPVLLTVYFLVPEVSLLLISSAVGTVIFLTSSNVISAYLGIEYLSFAFYLLAKLCYDYNKSTGHKLLNNMRNLSFSLCSKIDFLLVILILGFLIQDLYIIICNVTELLYSYIYSDNTGFIFNVSDSANDSTNKTTTTILHTSDGWAQGIKSIFVFGTGGLQLHLLRSGGTPLQRTFVVGSTIIIDAGSRALNNAINDPNYVEKHVNSWKRMWNNSTSELHIDVSSDPETLSKLSEVSKKFMADDQVLDTVVGYLKPILEPVYVEYSNELLANQIYGIGILLFIMSVGLIILLLAFIINITILVYSDKLMSFFTNKYILWYITINKKLIGLEILFLGGSLVYFLVSLSYGIHFIATHPVQFNN